MKVLCWMFSKLHCVFSRIKCNNLFNLGWFLALFLANLTVNAFLLRVEKSKGSRIKWLKDILGKNISNDICWALSRSILFLTVCAPDQNWQEPPRIILMYCMYMSFITGRSASMFDNFFINFHRIGPLGLVGSSSSRDFCPWLADFGLCLSPSHAIFF